MFGRMKAGFSLVLLVPLLSACLFYPRDPRERIEHVSVAVQATLNGTPVQSFCVVAQSTIGDFFNMYGPYWTTNGTVEFELTDVPAPLEVAIGMRSSAVIVEQANRVNGRTDQLGKISVVVRLHPSEKIEDIECHRWRTADQPAHD